MTEERKQSRAIPAHLHGRWAVVSAKTPSGESWGGEVLDEWVISSDVVESEGGRLVVKGVEELIEPHQALVLVSFTTHLQYAFMSAKTQPDAILVIAIGDGKEQMRYAITQQVYQGSAAP